MAGFIGSFLATLAVIVTAIGLNCNKRLLMWVGLIVSFLCLVPGSFVFVYFGFNPQNYYAPAVYGCTDWPDDDVTPTQGLPYKSA